MTIADTQTIQHITPVNFHPPVYTANYWSQNDYYNVFIANKLDTEPMSDVDDSISVYTLYQVYALWLTTRYPSNLLASFYIVIKELSVRLNRNENDIIWMGLKFIN